MKKFIKLYKRTLKPLEIEELIDVYFNRLGGFLIVYNIYNIRFIHPNHLTFISMIFGILAGVFFSKGNYSGLVIGAILLQIENFLDCADGQLARFKKITSRTGKTLDGLADLMTYISIYTGITIHLIKIGFNQWLSIALGISSIISMFIHIFFFDHFKNQFISFCIEEYPEKSEDLNELKRSYKNSEGINRIIKSLYYTFYRLEYKFTLIGYPKPYTGFFSIKKEIRERKEVKDWYYKNMKLSVRLWSLLGSSGHLILFVIFPLLNMPEMIFYFITGVYNIFMFVIILYQKKKLRNFIFLLEQNYKRAVLATS